MGKSQTAVLAPPPAEAPAATIPNRPKFGRKSRPFASPWEIFYGALGNVIANTDNLTTSDYREMATQDDAIKFALKYSSLCVCENLGHYENDNKRVKTYVDEMLARCETSFLDWAQEVVWSSKWAGYAVSERVVEYGAGKLWLKSLPVLDPELQFCMDQDPKSPRYGDVRGVRQTLNGSASFLDPAKELPVETLVIHTNDGFAGDPYGQSDLKACYPYYIAKKALRLQWARTLEKYGTPTALANAEGLNIEELSWKTGGGTVTRADNIMAMLESLGEDALGVMPKDIEVQFLQASTALGADFERHENHANKCMFRAQLLPSLLVDAGENGSFALVSNHFKVFLSSIMSDAAKLQRTFLRYVIAPFIRWNFGENAPIGNFSRPAIQDERLASLGAYFFSMTNAGYMTPGSREDSDLVRDQGGLKPLTDEQLKEAGKKAAAANAPKPGAGENMPPGVAPDGLRGTDPGQPHTTPQAPAGPQGRHATNGRSN